MKTKMLFVVLSLCLLAACASGPKVNLKYDYEISDMSTSSRPKWIDSEYILKLNEKSDGYKYYVGENDNASSKASKTLCRSSAEAKARYDFAAAIKSSIISAYKEVENSLGPEEKAVVKSSADIERVLNVDESVGGAEKYNDYWEQRSHQKKMGAAKDYKSFYCATIIRMKDETYVSVIQSASDRMIEAAKTPEASPAAVAGLKKKVAEKAVAASLAAPSIEYAE